MAEKRDKKKVGKKVGAVACIVGGLYGVYELVNSDGIKEVIAHYIGEGSVIREQLRQQIKECVKEAMAEYDAEKMEREKRIERGHKVTRHVQANEIIDNVFQTLGR